MPAVAPLIGGYLLAWIDWRAIFGFFLILSTVYFSFAFRQLPETRVLSKEDRPSFRELSGYYASILRSKKFWAYCTAYSTMTGGMLGYYSAMPYWYVSQLGISENHYAYLTIPTVAFYISGLLLNRNRVKRMGLDKLLLIGLAIAVSTAVLNITLAAMQVSGLIALVGLLSLFGFSAGLVMPSASAGATADFRAIAGPASALLTWGHWGTLLPSSPYDGGQPAVLADQPWRGRCGSILRPSIGWPGVVEQGPRGRKNYWNISEIGDKDLQAPIAAVLFATRTKQQRPPYSLPIFRYAAGTPGPFV